MYAHCCITNGDVPISCPDGQCPSSQHGSSSNLSKKEVSSVQHFEINFLQCFFLMQVRHLVTNDIYHLYFRLQLNTGISNLQNQHHNDTCKPALFTEVATNPKLTWCPRPGCETVCQLAEDAAPKRSKVLGVISVKRAPRNQAVVCSSCQFSFCSQCKTPWHFHSPCPSIAHQVCDQTRKPYDPEDPISQLEKDGHIKRCPFCQVTRPRFRVLPFQTLTSIQVPIERDDGCAQMMCKNCRHVFCWFCLASLDDDFMLRHYDSGTPKPRAIAFHDSNVLKLHRTMPE